MYAALLLAQHSLSTGARACVGGGGANSISEQQHFPKFGGARHVLSLDSRYARAYKTNDAGQLAAARTARSLSFSCNYSLTAADCC
jgi:hypothetical protein